MPCACQGKKKQWEVVQAGKVVFTGLKPTADTVAKRYPGSEVREKGAKPAEAVRAAPTTPDR